MPYTPLYIAATDITDSVARDFITDVDSRLDAWMQRTDDNLKSLALSLGVQPSQIYTPVNSMVKEYCIAYYCFLIFRDCYGENNPETNDNDIYKIKLELYKNETTELRSLISKEMLYCVSTSVNRAQWVPSGLIYI